MALVAYDYDSNSENEENEEQDTNSTVIIPEKTQISDADHKIADVAANPNHPIAQLLSDLPKTKPEINQQIVEDKLEDFVPKYQPQTKHQKVKITIPSLSEFNENDDDDDEPANKKSKPSPKGSSLLAILPPVKGSPLSTKSFIPNTLKNKPTTQKTTTPSTTASLVPNNIRKKAELAKKAAIEKATKKPTISNNPNESDDDGDDIEMPDTFDDEMWHKVCGRPKQQQKIIETKIEEQQEQPQINLAPEPEKPYDGLDNEAFKELVGKAKRPVNIKLVDINEEEILPEKDAWMTKALTDPENEPKPEVEEPVDPTKRKKHHITYLAQQAKVNEQTFKNQWAASKFTRNQTRAKYGF